MSLINYSNVSVSVGGTTLYATNASLDFEVPVEGVRAVGSRNAINTIPNGPIQGTLSVEYILAGTDPGVGIFNSIITNPGGYQGTNITFGGQSYSKAYLTSHSVSVESTSIATASISLIVFAPGGGPISQGGGASNTNVPIAHGAGSSIGAGAISFEYNASCEWDPVFTLGSQFTATAVTFRSARQSINLRGLNAGKAIAACPGEESVNVNLSALCGGGGGSSFGISQGKLVRSETSVSAGGFVEGSYEIIREY
jgi:hypothetical protein